jgi:hypothetical protein
LPKVGKFVKTPKEEEDCCVVVTLLSGIAMLIVIILEGDAALIVVMLEGDKRKRQFVGGCVQDAETS